MTKLHLAYQMPSTNEHLIPSDIIDQTFRVKVWQPVRTPGERFPVLFATDGDEFFDALSTIASCLQIHGETPRFILVGIGYENSRGAGLLRLRDFWPHSIRCLYMEEIVGLWKSSLVSGIDDLRVITEKTDANEYLRFIQDELMPFVANTYPTQVESSSYFGYSAGAGFGLFALFNQPSTFSNYILGSPATSYNRGQFAAEWANKPSPQLKSIEPKIFMSVGELEEFSRGMGRLDLVSGYFQLAKSMRYLFTRRSQLTLRVFPGETHATAWAPAFSSGLRAILGPATDVPFAPDYFRTDACHSE